MKYLNFLYKRLPDNCLSHGQELILAVVVCKSAANKSKNGIRVSEIIQMPHLGSPATVHKNYKFLENNGYVLGAADPTDQRTRYITLSNKGLSYAKKMDEYLKNT